MKPYIICHMICSIDGRIDCDMTEQIESGNEYYEALDTFNCQALLMGRVTMQMHYADPIPFSSPHKTPIAKEALFIAQPAEKYIIAADTHGSLCWPTNTFDGQSLIVITSTQCPKDYHDTLTKQGISWIAAGQEAIDLDRAMNILYDQFGIQRIALTGGGHINGAFLKAGLIDEISLMIAPGIDGRANMAAVFDGITDHNWSVTQLKLQQVKQVGEGTLWLRYTLKNQLK